MLAFLFWLPTAKAVIVVFAATSVIIFLRVLRGLIGELTISMARPRKFHLVTVQPAPSFAATRPAPNGHTNISDSDVTWQPSAKLTLALDGDYFIQRWWQDAAPGESSAPSHVDGGAA